MMLYQLLPIIKSQRTDCEERWEALKDNMPNPKDKSLIELGCANGYFMFKFIEAGGKLARGYDIDISCVNLISALGDAVKVDVRGVTRLPEKDFDIGFYLDTHYAPGTEGYLEYMKSHTKLSFISAAEKQNEFIVDINKIFKSVEAIYKGFEYRTIFKCEG